MKKKIIIIIAVLIAILLIAGIIVPMATKKKSGNDTTVKIEESASVTKAAASSDTKSEEAASVTEAAAPSDTKSEKSSSEAEVVASFENVSAESSSESGADQETENDDGNNGSGGGSPSGGGSADGQETAASSSDNTGSVSQSETQTPNYTEPAQSIPTISFPYAISGTDLVVEQIQSYSGYYIEDGSDKDISGVAAIVLTNNGGNLEFAGIGISQGDRSLAFSASQIPAGASVIILEQNGASFSSSEPYYSATATTTPVDSFDMSKELVTVEDNGNNALTVTNISGKRLSEVKIFYKNYLADEDVYVGGITYVITLTDVEEATSIDVSTDHFDSEYSVVVEVLAQ